MSELDEDDDDDFEWDPEVQKIFDDVSWDTNDIDPNLKLDSEVYLLRNEALCYPSIMYDLFYDMHPNPDSVPTVPTPMPRPKIAYPQKSTLTASEITTYIKYLPLYKNKSIADVHHKFHKNYREFKVIQVKIAKEQEVYQQYLLESANKLISEYNYVDEEAETWVKKCFDEASNQVKHYERYYVHLKDFGISVIPFKNDTPPTPVDTLFISLGYWNRLVNLTRKTVIPKPVVTDDKTKKKSSDDAWVKTVISKDENARRLAIAWKADVVISLGALQTLADNLPPFKNEWEMPAVVKVFDDGHEKHKVTFVDKALPAKRIAPREKNHMFFKEVVKHLSKVPNLWNISSDSGSKEKKNVRSESISGTFTDGTTSSGNENTSTVEPMHIDTEESLPQVDGANDTKKTRAKSTKNKSKASKTIEENEGSINEIKSTKTMQPEVSQSIKSTPFTRMNLGISVPNPGIFWTRKGDSSLPHADSGKFQPFIGRRGRTVSATQSTDTKEQKDSNDDTDKKDERDKLSPKFSGMSFGLLPDSALEFSQESDANEGESMPKEDVNKSTSKRRATRSSAKTKNSSETIESGDILSQTIISSFGKMSKNIAETKKKAAAEMATSTPSRRSKKTSTKKTNQTDVTNKTENEGNNISAIQRKKSRTMLLESEDSGSEKEAPKPKKKNTPSKAKPRTKTTNTRTRKKDTSAANKKGDASSALSKTTSGSSDKNKTTPVASKEATRPVLEPTTPATQNSQDVSSDLLGSILGNSDEKTSSKPTLRDVSASWASQAEEFIAEDAVNFATGDLTLIQPADNTNASYALWKFGKKRVLIRYAFHGDLIPHVSNAPKGQKNVLTGVSLRTKLEYQSDHVFEQLTQSELTRDWVTLLIKRKMCIVRARLDPHKREILDIEWTSSLHQFLEKAVAMGYNAAVTSKLLTKLFEMLSELDVGSYICCHRVDENKVILRKAVNDIRRQVVYDLQKEYTWPGRNVYYSTTAPWVPGDPNKHRKFHLSNDRVPMTFNPLPDAKDSKKSGKKKKKKSTKKTTSAVKEEDDEWP